jgi:hypothetical protein
LESLTKERNDWNVKSNTVQKQAKGYQAQPNRILNKHMHALSLFRKEYTALLTSFGGVGVTMQEKFQSSLFTNQMMTRGES